jgi:hypothetical protein
MEVIVTTRSEFRFRTDHSKQSLLGNFRRVPKSWALIPQADRWASKDKGWQRVTPQELVEILESEGLISTEQA